MQFNEKFRSWFIDDSVSSSGKIFVTTKIDPLFIFIQYLELNCTEKAQPLDQILEGSAEIFTNSLKISQMKLVADQKGPDDLKAFKFNKEKTLKWLKKKFELTKNSLIQKRIISAGASSSNFVKGSVDPSDEISDLDAVNEAALGIISEYISSDLTEELDKIFGICEKTAELNNSKRKSDAAINSANIKRIKVQEQENVSDIPNTPPQPLVKTSSKSKALEKAAKGSKSISSFFSKK
jgi:ribonuclease H2 subunit B